MKRVRRLAAWCALVAVCFVQLATAAHACAGMAEPEPSPHCHEAPAPAAAEHPGLCIEHCNGDAQVVDHHSPVSAPAVAVVPLTVAQACAEPAVAVPSRFAPDPAIPIPVFAASSRLRI
jgi:hypothetical protein